MREIKFRGKNGRSWHYGFFSLTEAGPVIYDTDACYVPYVVFPNTVGQFTGVHDKNGRDIYEGDIIENGRGWRHCVEYCDGCACFVARGGSFPPFMNQGSMNYYTVVGNVHDDPGLLVRGDEND